MLPFSWLGLNGSHEYATGVRSLKSLRPTVTDIETHKGGFADMSDEDVANETSRHDFCILVSDGGADIFHAGEQSSDHCSLVGE